jgi:hypothetical protein
LKSGNVNYKIVDLSDGCYNIVKTKISKAKSISIDNR